MPTVGECRPVPDRPLRPVPDLATDHREPWSDFLAAGLIAVCPVVELEFQFSARSLAGRLREQQLLREVFAWVPTSDRAYERAEEVSQTVSEPALILTG